LFLSRFNVLYSARRHLTCLNVYATLRCLSFISAESHVFKCLINAVTVFRSLSQADVGLFISGESDLFVSQLIGVVSISAWTLFWAILCFYGLKWLSVKLKLPNLLRRDFVVENIVSSGGPGDNDDAAAQRGADINSSAPRDEVEAAYEKMYRMCRLRRNSKANTAMTASSTVEMTASKKRNVHTEMCTHTVVASNAAAAAQGVERSTSRKYGSHPSQTTKDSSLVQPIVRTESCDVGHSNGGGDGGRGVAAGDHVDAPYSTDPVSVLSQRKLSLTQADSRAPPLLVTNMTAAAWHSTIDANGHADPSTVGGTSMLELTVFGPNQMPLDDLHVQVASDLHIEMWSRAGLGLHNELLDMVIVPSAPVLVLLGDVGTPAGMQGMQAYTSFVYNMAEKFELVLLLAGNHEFFSGVADGDGKGPQPMSVQDIKRAIRIVCELAPRGNVFFLDRLAVMVNDVRVAGCTLWTNIDPLAEAYIGSTANDFKLTWVDDETTLGGLHPDVRPLTPADTRAWHNSDVAFLAHEASIAKQLDQNLLVLTHHAPSFDRTVKAIHESSPLASAFCSNLDYMLQYGRRRSVFSNIHTWCFGHTHWNANFIKRGVRVLANQHGYLGASGATDNPFYDPVLTTRVPTQPKQFEDGSQSTIGRQFTSSSHGTPSITQPSIT
jgi:hypothetical protein